MDVLTNLNVIPDGIIGHSVGELGCAYADGCFTAEETILAAYSRGKASLESLDNDYIKGMMAAVGKNGMTSKSDSDKSGLKVCPDLMLSDFVAVRLWCSPVRIILTLL